MTRQRGLEAHCHCGAIGVTIAQPPDYMQDCDCSLCRKSGGVWGYFDPADVTVSGTGPGYTRRDYPEPAVEIRFCARCGATTHWILTEAFVASSGQNDRMGVNMKLFDGSDLTGVELRFPDGKNWFGEGTFGFRRAPVIIGEDYRF